MYSFCTIHLVTVFVYLINVVHRKTTTEQTRQKVTLNWQLKSSSHILRISLECRKGRII